MWFCGALARSMQAALAQQVGANKGVKKGVKRGAGSMQVELAQRVGIGIRGVIRVQKP